MESIILESSLRLSDIIPKMEISLRDNVGKTRVLDVEPVDSVENLLGKIEELTGCPPGSYTLVCDGRDVAPKLPACGCPPVAWGRSKDTIE